MKENNKEQEIKFFKSLNFRYLKKLGEGATGKVILAKSLKLNKFFAFKT